MKKLMTLVYAFFLCAPLTAAAQDVEINAENFPDENFRRYLTEQDYGKDGILTEEEISKITTLYLWSLGISNLQGIEYFTALTYLGCYDNLLATLDVSKNTALTQLDCGLNQLTTLDVSKNTALTFLGCYGNQLTTLDVSENTALTWLNCGLNLLTSLDVSKNTALTTLSCYDNQLTILDVSECTMLECFDCFHNQIKGEAMDFLISSLHPNTSDHTQPLYIYDIYSGSEGNVCTKSQVIAAKARGWQTYCATSFDPTTGWQWGKYEGMDDEVTSIAQPELKSANGDATIYTLSGQKVANAKKGIYVVDGKKVVVK